MEFVHLESQSLKELLQKQAVQGLALDIDDTLSLTDHYWITEMKRRFGDPENLTRDELVRKYRWIEEVPYWKTKGARELMQELTHSNEFQESIPVIENANQIVRQIASTVPVVAYITARPISVLHGTAQWLAKHDFPVAPIVFRPADITNEAKHRWKAEVLEYLYPQVLGIVDDSPDLAKHLDTMNYQGTVYQYGTRSEALVPCAISCESWTDVVSSLAIART